MWEKRQENFLPIQGIYGALFKQKQISVVGLPTFPKFLDKKAGLFYPALMSFSKNFRIPLFAVYMPTLRSLLF